MILRVAQSKHTTVDQEHMGVALDAAAPVDPTQTGIDGHSFTDPAEVEFWWEKGAQTAWQTVPLTLDTLDRYGLWESDFFKHVQAHRRPHRWRPHGRRRTSRSRSRRCSGSRC